MSYNPFEKEYQLLSAKSDSIKAKLSQLKTEKTEILEKVAETNSLILNEEKWFSENSIEDFERIESEAKEKVYLSWTHIEETRTELQHNKKEDDRIKSNIGSLLNPLNWFSQERKSWLIKAENNRQELECIRSKLKLAERQHKAAEQYLSSTTAQIKRYKNYQPKLQSLISKLSTLNSKTDVLNSEISELESEKKHLSSKLFEVKRTKIAVDAAIEPLVDKLRKQYKEIEEANSNARTAQDFANLLNQAQSKNERRRIHTECERLFENGKPQQIIDRSIKQLEGLNRSIIKLNDRITRLAQVASIDIQKIILDGSNLLNSQDDFIALKALIPVTNHLIKDYSVKVVFDPGASTILKINPAKLKNSFDERVEVIIATSEADELILDLAEDEKSIVLSKDGFAEFPDKDAVIQNRIFKPEITNSEVYIKELHVHIEI